MRVGNLELIPCEGQKPLERGHWGKVEWRGQDGAESEAGERSGENAKRRLPPFPSANMAHYVWGAGGETPRSVLLLTRKWPRFWGVGAGGGGGEEQEFSAVLEEGAHWGWGAKARWEVASEGTGGRKGESGGREDAGSRAWNAG